MNKKQRVSFKILLGIDNGFYNVGDKLPSLRDIADNEGVSIYTALNAFNELVSQGVIENRPKVGYFVPPISNRELEARLKEYEDAIPVRQKAKCDYDEQIYEQYVADMRRHRMGDYFKLPKEANEDISEDFFGNAVSYASQRVIRNTPSTKSWQFFKETREKLTSQIARWMREYKCLFRKDHIITLSHAVEAVMYAVRACYTPGKILGIESPGHASFLFCAKFMTLEYREIRSNPDTGLSVDDLVEKINGGAEFFAILLSGCNSVPTGATMPEENKMRLIEVCKKNNITIIEYDSFGRLNFSEHRSNPIKSLEH